MARKNRSDRDKDEVRKTDTEKQREKDLNKDPITGEPGSHPVGTGIGAASGGVAGAAIGAAAGPIGALVGAGVGAVAGGLAGHAVAEGIDPTAEEEHWRGTYADRPYVERNRPYEDYQPAYRYGWEACGLYGCTGRRFDEVEPQLREGWTQYRGDKSQLDWDQARLATRDAWNRVHPQGVCAHKPGQQPKDQT